MKGTPADSGITDAVSGKCGKWHRLDCGRADLRSGVPAGSESLPLPVLPGKWDMPRVHTNHIPLQETLAELRAHVGSGSPTPTSGATAGLQQLADVGLESPTYPDLRRARMLGAGLPIPPFGATAGRQWRGQRIAVAQSVLGSDLDRQNPLAHRDDADATARFS
jgi:hypothetical protein